MARLAAVERTALPDRAFAYIDSSGRRRLPIHDASHVRNALARFDQVTGVSDEERDLAFANVKKAAKHYGVEMTAKSWRELGKPHGTKKG